MSEIKTKIPHTLNLLEREKIEVLGVVEVISSTEKEIVVKLENDYMHIFGNDLKITKLSPEEMLLDCHGKVSGIEYTGRSTKKSLFGKVFK